MAEYSFDEMPATLKTGDRIYRYTQTGVFYSTVRLELTPEQQAQLPPGLEFERVVQEVMPVTCVAVIEGMTFTAYWMKGTQPVEKVVTEGERFREAEIAYMIFQELDHEFVGVKS